FRIPLGIIVGHFQGGLLDQALADGPAEVHPGRRRQRRRVLEARLPATGLGLSHHECAPKDCHHQEYSHKSSPCSRLRVQNAYARWTPRATFLFPGKHATPSPSDSFRRDRRANENNSPEACSSSRDRTSSPMLPAPPAGTSSLKNPA